MLRRLHNEHTGRKEYALVSHKGKVLEWFGVKKPSKGRFQKAEARVEYYKNQGEG